MNLGRTAAFLVMTIMACLIPAAALAANAPSSMAFDALAAPGGTSTFRIALYNSDPGNHSYTLALEGLSDAFRSYFTVDGAAADTVGIAALGSTVVVLQVETPANPTQNRYDFSVVCTRDDGNQVSLPAQITINSDYAIAIVSEIKQLESLNGKSVSFDIAVTNTGNKALEGIGIAADLPYKWVAESVTPEKLSLLPGESGAFRLGVMIPATQGSGSMEIGISAGNAQVQSQMLTIPVKVTANANFALIIIGCVVAVGFATFIYFRKHGRR